LTLISTVRSMSGTGASLPSRRHDSLPSENTARIGPLLTATVTATAAATGDQQRPATAHNSRTIHVNLGYVRPQKQTVEDQCRPAVTAANTAAKPLDNACPVRTILECRPSVRLAMDGPGRCAYSYGSEGS